MKRKLFSTLLCAFALLLLMGAGTEPDTAALVIEEESVSSAQGGQTLETGPPAGEEEDLPLEENPENPEDPAQEENPDQGEPAPEEDPGREEESQEQEEQLPGEEGEEPLPEEPLPEEPAPSVDLLFQINGWPASLETGRTLDNGVTYVALAPTVRQLAPEAQINWDGAAQTVTVTTPILTLTAHVGDFYAEANGRFLYIQDGVQLRGNRVYVPLKVLTEAFDAQLSWDGATGGISIWPGSGALVSGDAYYNQDDLFWLSRIIYVESGNQPLKGKMAVGNVVLNRVESPLFPDNIVDVLSQRNQFTSYQGGRLAERTPNSGSILAAKLVLDGGVVEETRGALYFDSLDYSWAARIKTCVGVIGAHKFYR